MESLGIFSLTRADQCGYHDMQDKEPMARQKDRKHFFAHDLELGTNLKAKLVGKGHQTEINIVSIVRIQIKPDSAAWNTGTCHSNGIISKTKAP